jgi:hypothetical protein
MKNAIESARRPKPYVIDWRDVVECKLASVRFGAVHLIVQDSKVVQIETSERIRFDRDTGMAS